MQAGASKYGMKKESGPSWFRGRTRWRASEKQKGKKIVSRVRGCQQVDGGTRVSRNTFRLSNKLEGNVANMVNYGLRWVEGGGGPGGKDENNRAIKNRGVG